jgi:hypothetical protein
MAKIGESIYDMPYDSFIKKLAREEELETSELEKQLEIKPIYLKIPTKLDGSFEDENINERLEGYDYVTDFRVEVARKWFGFDVAKLVQGTGIRYKKENKQEYYPHFIPVSEKDKRIDI